MKEQSPKLLVVPPKHNVREHKCEGSCREKKMLMNKEATHHQQKYDLKIAVEGIDADELTRRLRSEEDPSDCNADGWMALHSACHQGDNAAVQCLITFAVDVDLPLWCGKTALHIAVLGGHVDLVERLLVNGHANVNARTADGILPIHLAVTEHSCEMLQLLINAGADVDQTQDSQIPSPLLLAVILGYSEGAKLIISAGADVNTHTTSNTLSCVCRLFPDAFARMNFTSREKRILSRADVPVIVLATLRDDSDTVSCLLSSMVIADAPDKCGSTALHHAACSNKPNILKHLTDSALNLNVQNVFGNAALHLVAKNGYLDLVDKLITCGAMVNIRKCNDGWTPLHRASENSHTEVIEKLVSLGANVDAVDYSGCSALHLAAASGLSEVVVELLRLGATIDLVSGQGLTPLCYAAENGFSEVASILIKAGAQVEFQASQFNSTSGASPMHLAALCGHENVLLELVESGARADRIILHSGLSVLHMAASGGYLNVVTQLVVNHGASVDSQSSDGITPLLVGVQQGHTGVASRLIELGADLNLATTSGWLPIQCAIALGYKVAAESLRQCSNHSATQSSSLRTRSLKLVSLDLHERLLKAGFCSTNAAVQSGCACVLEEITRNCRGINCFLFGSFADGWASCLTRGDARIDRDSDLDLTCIEPRDIVSIAQAPGRCRGCRCVRYKDGHVFYKVHSTRPNRVIRGSSFRPAVDRITAYPCTGYPAIKLLDAANYPTQLSPSVLRSLRQEFKSPRCHIVSAAPPGHEGSRMRVSTTFLELIIMQSLNTVQGQLFVLIKYLIKRVISKKVAGLKTYHAKNLLFHMLDKTPGKEWIPEKLIELLDRSLERLLAFLDAATTTTSKAHGQSCDHCDQLAKPLSDATSSKDSQCMVHFLLQDAAIFLTKGHESKRCIAEVVKKVKRDLQGILSEFVASISTENIEIIEFHPFLFMPILDEVAAPSHPSGATVSYHEIYDLVRHIFSLLSNSNQVSQDEVSHSFELQMKMINSLPDSARTTRECLQAMLCFRFGKPIPDSIRRSGSSVCRGIPCPSRSLELSTDGAKDLVWKHLEQNDSAWKFCFEFSEGLNFSFLPGRVREAFPLQAGSYGRYGSSENHYYMNFDALKKALQMEEASNSPDACLTAESLTAENWLGQLGQNSDADLQELLAALQYCNHKRLVLDAIHGHSEAIAAAGLGARFFKLVERWADPEEFN